MLNGLRLLFLFVLLPALGSGQPGITGLGKLRIGITTSDSLNLTVFKKEEQSYVKGTLALPCDHIQTFTSPKVEADGTTITNVVLYFYDNKLFRISCDYTNALKEAFGAQYKAGTHTPATTFQLCATANRSLVASAETWTNADIIALVVYKKGYNASCEPEDGATLTILSLDASDLSSECALRNSDPLTDEYIDALK
ncbi:hypothetical protein [Spirosoma fluminis]